MAAVQPRKGKTLLEMAWNYGKHSPQEIALYQAKDWMGLQAGQRAAGGGKGKREARAWGILMERVRGDHQSGLLC